MTNKAEYRLNTKNIEVTVKPEYIDSQISNGEGLFIWTYHITIKNKSNESIQLINRYWKIIDENGEIQEVSGIGAVGEQPILEPNENFKYSSAIHLKNPSGIMRGYYGMKKADGKIIKISIPAFSLDVPNITKVIH